jgi:hypothetical protein
MKCVPVIISVEKMRAVENLLLLEQALGII